jgi:NAD(P)-dependent dehydrogenase (short-subunit alcohol dehydrogenase family)
VNVDGAVALVTGAGSGIGAAAATRFAAAGARVVVTDVDAGAGEEVAARIGATFHALDVADPAAWDAVVDRIVDGWGRLDLVHLNAGIRLGIGEVTELGDDDYLRIVAVNQHGVFFGLRATVPPLRRADPGPGHVVVTASRASLGPLPNDLGYAMAKHAVVGLVRSAAPALAEQGIRVNAICPATVDTGFLGGVGRERLEAAGIEVMDSEEVAEGILEIIAGDTTGEVFVQLPGGRPEPFEFAPVPGR